MAPHPPDALPPHAGTARRVHHYDVNVRDLDTTLDFLTACTSFDQGERRRSRAGFLLGDGRTLPERQDAAGEIEHVLLRNTTGPGHPTLHLMRWIDPPPRGEAHTVPSAVGFYRIVMHSPDLAQSRNAVLAAGFEPFAPTTGDDFRFDIGTRGPVPFTAFACHDPNGIVVEFVAGPEPRLSVVAQGTRRLRASSALLVDVLGLERYDTVRTIDPTPDVYRPGGGHVRFHGDFLRPPGDPRGYVDLLQFTDPAPAPAYVESHHIGVMRAVFEVDDVDAAWARVLACAARIVPEYPPTPFSFGSARGDARVAGFRDHEHVRYQLLESKRANTS